VLVDVSGKSRSQKRYGDAARLYSSRKAGFKPSLLSVVDGRQRYERPLCCVLGFIGSEYLRETLPKPGEATAQRLTKRRLNAPAASLP
jgi:hypothetical protein